ncbi:MAG: CDP-diacylglycerol--glycerol-3-phosphate 3-phosphatidyltransferase [Alphaproteobacteria bacterium]|nr:CDP-diacylglycerol--glycerol-3-phosphate 3-phosphatidyltransferase [Alphaproteobacteria bacterium]
MNLAITPNQVTIFRIIVAPLIALCICVDSLTIAFVLFVLAGISDWYDGHLARQTNSTSVFGRVFDSIADKLLVSGTLLALVFTGRCGKELIFPVLVIVLREFFIAGLREYTLRVGESKPDIQDKTMATTNLARIKTTLQMVAIGMLIIPRTFMYPYLGILGGLVLWAAAGISVYTAWQYWKEVRASVKAGMA